MPSSHSTSSLPYLLIIGGITETMREAVSSHFALIDYFESDDKEGLIAHHADGIRAILTNGHDGVPDDLITRLPHLDVISCYGVGYDAIDVALAAQRGILVTHTPDVLNDEVAITAIMLLFGVARQLPLATRWIKQGQWAADGNAPLSRSPKGMKIGMVGYGRIGQTIADKLRVFGCEISYHARSQKHTTDTYFANLIDMASVTDALIIITPGGASTRHLITQDILEAVGPEGIVINVARGSVIDEKALVDCLVSGKLGGAGLDVFDNEPHVPHELLEMDNVICTPHIGSASVETRAEMGRLSTDNLIQFFTDGSVLTSVPETAHLCQQVSEDRS